jgi:mannose-6-phosphate isomerase-like protein (cupin superfamily)
MAIASPISDIRDTRTALVRLPEEVPTIDLMGVRVKVVVTSADTDGAWALLDYTAPPLFRGPLPHWHGRTEEMFQVLEGTLTVHADGVRSDIPAGGFVLIPPGVVHQFSNDTPDPVRFLTHVRPGGIDVYFQELAELVRNEAVWPPADPSRLRALMERHDSFPPAV